MKKIIIPKEADPNEKRVALLPYFVAKLKKLGFEIQVEKGLGDALFLSDEEYQKAGASIESDRRKLLQSGDIILRVKKPPMEEIPFIKKGAIHISFLDPFKEQIL
ncbi:MAG: NAD(P)(+) transhydrogenase (Re/Si-specific) subunit alpha, partial [Chlamydiota bacterium]